MTNFRRKNLTCGCCGAGFYTWPDYIDQDQDTGFGICADCQDWITDRNNTQLDELADKIEATLKPANAAKFKAMDTDKRRMFAWKAIDDGLVTWSIGR